MGRYFGIHPYSLPNDYQRSVMKNFVDKLHEIEDFFRRQHVIHFYASSLLFVYEGLAVKCDSEVELRMIDFTHVFPSHGTPDANYVAGVCGILRFLRTLLADEG